MQVGKPTWNPTGINQDYNLPYDLPLKGVLLLRLQLLEKGGSCDGRAGKVVN